MPLRHSKPWVFVRRIAQDIWLTTQQRAWSENVSQFVCCNVLKFLTCAITLDNAHHNQLMGEDSKIEAHNLKVRKLYETLRKAEQKVQKCSNELSKTRRDSEQYQRRLKTLWRARASQDSSVEKYRKEIAEGQLKLGETGSGKIKICIPHEEWLMTRLVFPNTELVGFFVVFIVFGMTVWQGLWGVVSLASLCLQLGEACPFVVNRDDEWMWRVVGLVSTSLGVFVVFVDFWMTAWRGVYVVGVVLSARRGVWRSC